VTDTWIVLVEDRHSDVDAVPFTTQAMAFAAARLAVPDDAAEEPLSEAMRRSGWELYLPYGSEGDCVRVVKRTMDDAARLR
jgi:hypothetical protein